MPWALSKAQTEKDRQGVEGVCHRMHCKTQMLLQSFC